MVANKLINFRCPDNLLTAIESYGRENYPIMPNKRGSAGYDQSKTIRDILICGIESLTNGEVKIEKPKSSHTNYAKLLDMLNQNSRHIAELLNRITKIEAQVLNSDMEARSNSTGIVKEFNANS